MARQVFFDPFGMYAQGLRAGQQDQMALQNNVRRARLDDYNYNNVLPLTTQLLQDKADLSRYTMPAQRQLADIGLSRAQNQLYAENLGNADELARRLNITAPMMQLLMQHYGFSGSRQPNGNTAYYGYDPTAGGNTQIGNVVDPNAALFNYVNQARYDAERKMQSDLANQQFLQQLRIPQLYNDAMRSQTYRDATDWYTNPNGRRGTGAGFPGLGGNEFWP